MTVDRTLFRSHVSLERCIEQNFEKTLVIYLIYPQMVLTGSPSGKYPFDVEHSRRCCRITFAITGFVVASPVNFEPFFTLLSLLIIVTTPKSLWTEICKNEIKLN